MCQYITNVNPYYADSFNECDESYKLLLSLIQTQAGTATKLIISVSTRTIYTSSHNVYTTIWTNSNNPPLYFQQLLLRQLSEYGPPVRKPVTHQQLPILPNPTVMGQIVPAIRDASSNTAYKAEYSIRTGSGLDLSSHLHSPAAIPSQSSTPPPGHGPSALTECVAPSRVSNSSRSLKLHIMWMYGRMEVQTPKSFSILEGYDYSGVCYVRLYSWNIFPNALTVRRLSPR
jgi:hypothetical protein